MKQAFWILVAALVTAGVPDKAWAQEAEEDDPPVVRLSFFMCDLGSGNGDRIEEELETRDIPIWREIVSEGTGIQDYGYIFHWWADEWNVGIFTIAESIQAILDASEKAGDRFEERYGDAPTAFEKACPHHRDGFYTLGPSVGNGAGAAAVGGR